MDTKMVSKLYHTAATVAAHGAFAPIGIIIFHFKIVAGFWVQQHQAVCTDPKPAVAQELNLVDRQIGNAPVTVINDNKIISRALIFVKVDFHAYQLNDIQ